MHQSITNENRCLYGNVVPQQGQSDDERGVLFKKKNGNIHHFSHASCFAMEAFIEILEEAERGHNFRCSSNTATDEGFVLETN